VTRRPVPTPPRRGLALVVVMAALAACVVIGIALLQAQATALRVAENGRAGELALRAAESGMAHALSDLQSPTWAGVGSIPSAEVGRDGAGVWSYRVTLTPAAWDGTVESAMKLDVTSVGSYLPTGSARAVERTIGATLQLIPRLPASGTPSDRPVNADWDAAQAFTVFAHINMSVPPQAKVFGNAWSYDNPNVYAGVAWPAAVRDRAAASGPEPITGKLTVNQTPTAAESANLTALLGAGDWSQSTAFSALPPLSPNGFETTVDYRVYAGGPVCRSTAIATDTLDGTALNPVVLGPTATNPLGIYYRNGGLTLVDNVRITGTLVVKDNLFATGPGLQVRAVRTTGSGGIVSLPAVVVDGDFDIRAGASLEVTGLVYAKDRIYREAVDRQAGTSVAIEGATMSDRLDIQTPPMWQALSSSDWTNRGSACPTGTSFLPWLANAGNWLILFWPLNYTLYGLSNEPTFTVTRPSDTSYISAPPLFRPDPAAWNAGGGYRWTVLAWREVTP